VPQLAHARWRSLGSPHCGQEIWAGADRAWCDRRLFFFETEVLRFGTGMGIS